ncbi:MAG: hypothetical protein WD850_02355 [Candidatus Spechtbacterales bacterium]
MDTLGIVLVLIGVVGVAASYRIGYTRGVRRVEEDYYEEQAQADRDMRAERTSAPRDSVILGQAAAARVVQRRRQEAARAKERKS